MKILDTGRASASENMSFDERFLRGLEHDPEPLIHLYDWEREAATYGHFTDPSLLLRENDLDLAKRPTGGGIIFHTGDLAFSLLIPAGHPLYSTNTLRNYHTINQLVARAIEAFTEGRVVPTLYTQKKEARRPAFCMAAPTIYDLVVGEKKVAGAAQRRTKFGLLHQGTICLTHPTQLNLLQDEKLAHSIQKNSYPILLDIPLELARKQLKRKIIEAFQ